MKGRVQLFSFVLLLLLLGGCGKENGFSVKGFELFTNFEFEGDTLELPMDLDDAVFEGIIIPTQRQTPSGFFEFKFQIRNTTDSAQHYLYKIFYQNESYKHAESEGTDRNAKAADNFYGGWGKADESFHKTPLIPADGEYHTIVDSFRIAGNPRNEKRFLGASMIDRKVTEVDVKEATDWMQIDSVWWASVQANAKRDNVPIDEQMHMEAIWAIRYGRRTGTSNNRWKRNPRAGAYQVSLAIANGKDHNRLAPFIQDITVADSAIPAFANPFHYFKHGKGKPQGLEVIRSDVGFRTKATLDIHKGVHVDISDYPWPNYSGGSMDQYCGDTDSLYARAHFEQHFHQVNRTYSLSNIPVIADVDDNYTVELYEENKAKYDSISRIRDYVHITECPCNTVGYESEEDALFVSLPGNQSGPYRKENTAIKTRVGFTYGKIRAKIKFPALINKHGVWNGATCAFWLLYQAEEEWNNRTPCEYNGYIPKHIDGGRDDDRVKNYHYSEIDFEIVKTSAHWPATSYQDSEIPPVDDPTSNRDIIVNCTNWDLACGDPGKFDIGVHRDPEAKHKFELHRWDHWYKALTSKHAMPHDGMMGSEFYYEFEWKPNEIIWRVGPTLDKMEIVGYMNSAISKIPDNQMTAIISQEFHDGSWWPMAPYHQDNIPFPQNDIKAYVYELVIE